MDEQSMITQRISPAKMRRAQVKTEHDAVNVSVLALHSKLTIE